ncbi:MAG: aminopeptidase [Treponema sp.]|jgi:aspartyl aminopeptidase|nr:aminopeptidase [Treponema sp.]
METEEKKTGGQLLAEELLVNKKSCWEGIGAEEREKLDRFAGDYKQFLDAGKTEREFTAESQKVLEARGFKDLDALMEAGKPLAPGTAVYRNNRGKSIIFAVTGKKPAASGVNILGAHIDSPRLDLKNNPLYEDGEMAIFDTHYYGGIKKYQWLSVPLALHGVFIRPDGKKIELRIGEDPSDPVLVITDLLPHLAQEQMQKKASELFSGEDLDALAGSIPYPEKELKERVKLNLLKLLHDAYGIVEQDFAGAELELVPAAKARDVGLDRSMIGGYGHDDRCCAYTALRAVLEFAGKQPPKTVIGYLSDKEEIGSYGNTGAAARFFENFIADLASLGAGTCAGYQLHRLLEQSCMLSADVGAAFDPRFADVYDKKGSPYLGKGLSLTKYTGARGKFGGSDANAEFYNKVIRILDARKLPWQFGDLGRVDQGGGGTIALYAAQLGIEVLDCGIAVLSMHSPFEVISKIDLYTTYQAYLAFLEDA